MAVDADVKLGRDVRIFDPTQVNMFGCEIGEGSFVGPFVEITRGVTIGAGCKIESHSFICDGVTIEDNVFVGHGVMFANDLYPRSDRQVERLRTLVCEGAGLGSGCTIVGGVRIGRFSVVGAGAVVTRDVADFAIVAGNPAREIRRFADHQEFAAFMETRQRSATPEPKNIEKRNA